MTSKSGKYHIDFSKSVFIFLKILFNILLGTLFVLIYDLLFKLPFLQNLSTIGGGQEDLVIQYDLGLISLIITLIVFVVLIFNIYRYIRSVVKVDLTSCSVYNVLC